MVRAFHSELYRLRRRWMPWVMIAAIAVVALVFYELLWVTATTQLQLLRSGNAPASAVGAGGPAASIRQLEDMVSQLRPSQVHTLGVSIVSGVGSVLLIVFAASHVGTEYGWGTLRTMLASGASRGAFLGVKLATAVVFGAVFALVGVVAMVAASYLVSAQGGLAPSAPDVGLVAAAYAKTVFVFLPYVALASLIALWARSSGAGIGVGLVIYFAESIVASIVISLDRGLARIVDLGLSRNVSSITHVSVVTTGTESTAPPLPDAGQAAAVLAVWTILFVAVAYWRLRTRDVTLA